jgi:hypothetical protein
MKAVHRRFVARRVFDDEIVIIEITAKQARLETKLRFALAEINT